MTTTLRVHISDPTTTNTNRGMCGNRYPAAQRMAMADYDNDIIRDNTSICPRCEQAFKTMRWDNANKQLALEAIHQHGVCAQCGEHTYWKLRGGFGRGLMFRECQSCGEVHSPLDPPVDSL